MTTQEDMNAAWFAQQAQLAEQAEAMALSLARTVMTFWKTLLAEGMDQASAVHLTRGFMERMIGKVDNQ